MTADELPPLIKGLLARHAHPNPSATECVELVETHISWVLLVNGFAYKIKKPVQYGFLDFSTLDLRKRACDEELRINQRYSADLYLEVVPITGSPALPYLEGSGQPIEYAVKMRRFPTSCLFDHLLAAGRLLPVHVRQLAEALSAFHRELPRDETDQHSAHCGQLQRHTEANFLTITSYLSAIPDLDQLAILRAWSTREFLHRESRLISRAAQGYIRECHGDLHLGNIVWLNDRARFFDGIEFSADLRWIDTMNEAAFPIMDLEVRGAQPLAFAFLNHYLELTGDYQGVALLRYYRLYRALVRAKVALLCLHPLKNPAEQDSCMASYRRYIAYGLALIRKETPRLIITHGLSGSGKSHLAAQLAASMPAIWVRSDVERKRLFGRAPDNAREPHPALYGVKMTNLTYQRLMELAQHLLESGYSVILDGTFLRRRQRRAAFRIAQVAQTPYWILDFQAPLDLLKARVQRRAMEGLDPSDANAAVVNLQAGSAEPLEPEEMDYVVPIDSAMEPDLPHLLRRIGQVEKTSVTATLGGHGHIAEHQ